MSIKLDANFLKLHKLLRRNKWEGSLEW